MTQRQKCFHCDEENGVLVRLNPSGNVKKMVCMGCLWVRHRKTAFEILEYILNREEAESQGNEVGDIEL